MEVAGKTMQQKSDDPGDPARRDNLERPRVDALRGSQTVYARGSSFTLQAQKLPRGVALAALLLVGGAAVLAARRDA